MEDYFKYLFPGPLKHTKAQYAMDYETNDGSRVVRKAPFFLNPYIIVNAGILVSYFDTGLSSKYWLTPMTYYLVTTLDIDATQYSAFTTLIALPSSLKLAFGFLIDGVPIFEYRRKSWLILTWIAYISVALWMWVLATPDFMYCVILCFLLSAGYYLGDVCNDSLSIERARYEPQDIRGGFQTSGQTIRALGAAVGAAMGAVLYNTDSWGWGLTIGEIFLLAAFIPISGILPLSWPLVELAPLVPYPSLKEQLRVVWQTAQNEGVWYPMIFIYLWNAFQVPNGALTNFLIDGLNFTDFDIGMLTFVGALFRFLGIFLFKQVFFETSWRWLYVVTTFIGSVLLIGTIVVAEGWNVAWGIPDFPFVLMNVCLVYLIQGIQNMPFMILFGMQCPSGYEGLIYAFLTTMLNLAAAVGTDLATGFTKIWDVDNAALSDGDYSGFVNLTILTTCLHLFPLLFIGFMPDNKVEARQLLNTGMLNKTAGYTFIIVAIGSLLGTIGICIYFIVFD